MEPRLDIIGAALADPSRSRILCEMMDGRAFTNKELACAAEISAQTASVHLKHLQAAGLTSSIRSGRCVYHRIASEDVAGVLEALAGLSPTDHLNRAKSRKMPEANIMRARSCYNHIAGRLGVLITNHLIALGVIRLRGEAIEIDAAGEAFFNKFGINIASLHEPSKPLVKLCLDWTERKHHLSGPLATALMNKALQMKWIERRSGSRALVVTEVGYEVFERDFGIPCSLIDSTDDPYEFGL
ncbi:metalloregulator ArsR/SmtB family transcription factor [Loktanella sp. 5RATIMAR09]|uniref:ArsR/SmtB family transcription factor n=1 Tax=Loktanella sp. 5RATIMAR09 TaxID=1225655 RepID=UPI000A637329|nr:metalloregulator ArsR/SmtB family transcription factor [Loktanella sp. 5RATIMAR09]